AAGDACAAPPAGGRWLRDVVTADAEFAGAAGRLLAGAVVVDDLAAARAAVAEADVVAVTRDGDVLSRASAGGGTSAGPSVLELHAAHEEAAAEVDAATARAEQARFALVAARDRV